MSSCVLVGLVEAPGVAVGRAVGGVGEVSFEDAEGGLAGFADGGSPGAADPARHEAPVPDVTKTILCA